MCGSTAACRGHSVLQYALKDQGRSLNARSAHLVQEVILFEPLPPPVRRQVTAMQQLTADECALLPGKPVHEFRRFQIGPFRSRSIVFGPSAMPHSQDKNPGCYGAANFPFSSHACAETTGDFQGRFHGQVTFFPEGVKYRLRSVVPAQQHLSRNPGSVRHHDPASPATQGDIQLMDISASRHHACIQIIPYAPILLPSRPGQAMRNGKRGRHGKPEIPVCHMTPLYHPPSIGIAAPVM